MASKACVDRLVHVGLHEQLGPQRRLGSRTCREVVKGDGYLGHPILPSADGMSRKVYTVLSMLCCHGLASVFRPTLHLQ